MLVLDRKTGTFEDRHFYDVLDYLREGDCLVLNDSRVLPARLYGGKMRHRCGGGAAAPPSKRGGSLGGSGRARPPGKAGGPAAFREGLLEAEVIEILEGGNRLVQFDFQGNFTLCLSRWGRCRCRITSRPSSRTRNGIKPFTPGS